MPANGSTPATGYVDVSAFSGLIVQLSPAANTSTFQFQFYDAIGTSIIENTFPSNTSSYPTLTMATGGLIAFTYALAVRGPLFNILTSGASSPTLGGIWGTNVPLRFDGIHTLAGSGAVLASGAAALTAFQTLGTALPSYTGPAVLYGEAQGATISSVGLQQISGPTTFAKLDLMRSASGPAFDTRTVWIPSVPCQIQLVNGATAQTVSYVLIAA
jgi:hypothetical protein